MADFSFPAASGTLRAYLATPSTPGPWPGVVVVHEAFGLTDDIRKQADRFAAHGYLAIAPSLYSYGNPMRCLIATVRTLSKGQGPALEDINASREYLAAREDCTGRVGVIGFCLGGGLAVLASTDPFAAAAPNYGFLPKDTERRLENACPVVASYGGKDRPLRGAAAKLEKALTALDVAHDVKEYPQAHHGFLFEHTGKTAWTQPLLVKFDADAADDAWRRIFAFFDMHVKGAE